MAGYPPPFPGYPDPRVDPRLQRRMERDRMRDQQRAQKMAYEAQRRAQRQQARLDRRGSILGPLLVVAVGVAFLLLRLGRVDTTHLVLLYARWWPALLVLAGLVLLAEWGLDQRAAAAGRPPVRRGLGAGVVFLVILIVLAGLTARGVLDGRETLRAFSITPDNVGEFLGERHERSQQLDEDLPAGIRLVIDNPHGDVSVMGQSGDGRLHVTVDKQVYTFNDEDADSKAGSLDAHLVRTGDTVRLDLPSVSGGIANVSITLPKATPVTVNSGRGAVHLASLEAPVLFTANNGDVDVQSVKGPVTGHLNNRHNSFSAHAIDGAVTVDGHADNLTLTDISGAVSLDGDFYGDTHLEHVAGAVAFTTSRTQLSFARLDGETDISAGSELTASSLTGPTRLRTRSRNIELGGVTGDVSVTNSNGSVELTRVSPGGNVSVDNSNGSIELTLPDRAGFDLTAETRNGSVNDQFGLASTADHERTHLAGKVGDGSARIDLHTTHADIDVNRGAVASAAASTPTASAPPPATGTKPKHGATRSLPLTPTPAAQP